MFETFVRYCSTLQAQFAPYPAQSLELTLPSLRFYFHDGVREACAMSYKMNGVHTRKSLRMELIKARSVLIE